MLTRFFGVYKVKVKFMHAINIIVMEDCIGKNKHEVTGIYDLKGSRF